MTTDDARSREFRVAAASPARARPVLAHPAPARPAPARLTPRSPAAVPRRTLLAASALVPLTAATLSACGLTGTGGAEPELRAELPRAEAGDPATAGKLTIPFAARMLGALDRALVNAVCSPLSAQVALTMLGMGAAGQTRTEMEEVLGGSMDELAEAANTLSQTLATVGDAEREAAEEVGGGELPDPARASLVNGTWAQEGLEIQEPFLEDLATWFGSGVFQADFTADGPREQAREEINGWVAGSTEDLIQELLAEGVLRPNTRLVLVNALHLKAAWPEELTRQGGTFTPAGGGPISCEMLHGMTVGWYEDSLCTATRLATHGDQLSLALVRPERDLSSVLDEWSASADDPAAGLAALLTGLEDPSEQVQFAVPALDIGWDDSLKDLLVGLGMGSAFSDGADFSGVTGAPELAIDEVVQKAVLTLDEQGMEAAAATAVIARETSMPVIDHEITFDVPFLLVAYERATGAPLVAGWVGDPTQTR